MAADDLADVTVEKRCTMCPNMVRATGPKMLMVNANVYCSETCERLWDAITPGHWVDAAELMPGGTLSNRPDIWSDPDGR